MAFYDEHEKPSLDASNAHNNAQQKLCSFLVPDAKPQVGGTGLLCLSQPVGRGSQLLQVTPPTAASHPPS